MPTKGSRSGEALSPWTAGVNHLCGRVSLIVSANSQGAFVSAPCRQAHSRIRKGRAWQVQPRRCGPWPASLTEGGGAIPLSQSQVPSARRVPDLRAAGLEKQQMFPTGSPHRAALCRVGPQGGPCPTKGLCPTTPSPVPR